MALIDQLTDYNFVRNCWKRFYSSKSPYLRSKPRGIDGVTLEDFQHEVQYQDQLHKVIEEIRNGNYVHLPLRGFTIEKPGKPKDRLVTVATTKDTLVHNAILGVIAPIVFDYINNDASFCGIKKDLLTKSRKMQNSKNALQAIKKLGKSFSDQNYFVYESDIKGFFDNLSKNVLFDKLTALLPDSSINHIIEQIIFFNLGNSSKFDGDQRVELPKTKYGISQGSPLSPIFSNIYLADFDRELTCISSNRLIRYVDDFIIVAHTEKEAKMFGKKAETIMNKAKLELSDEKTFLKNMLNNNDEVNFLGLNITRHKVTSKKKTSETIKFFENDVLNKTNKIYQRCKTDKDLVDSMNYRIKGWEAHYKYYHVEDIYRGINAAVQRKQKMERRFRDLQLLNSYKLTPFVNEKKWKMFFGVL
jgi:retron-type reverse transcriptase